MKRALQWDPQVCSFLEEKLKMMLLLSQCKQLVDHPIPPGLPCLASHTANPKLGKEVTSYRDCS